MTDHVPLEVQTASIRDRSIVNYEHEAEVDESEHQVLWNSIMAEGNYKNPSTYKKAEVLLLCWEKESTDMTTEQEVKKLQSVFEKRFRYNTHIRYLDNHDERRLQVRLNAKVASFVDEHDGPNTLLIVYYAGHGKPGLFEGQLELHGQTSPNDKEKRLFRDRLVWNRTEELLRYAEADVLEIFDCCYAGTLGWDRGQQKSFEYLAATKEMGSTPVPGDDSFTSALIFALESLVMERPGGRFTTVELLKKIIQDAPNFPKNQFPILSDRSDKNGCSAGRIMLHPLETEGLSASMPDEEVSRSELAKGPTLTLHFDFGQKPSKTHIEIFGRGLNKFFEQNTLGVNGVRWGGMQSTATKHARRFLERVRRAGMERQIKEKPTIQIARSDELLPGSGLILPATPPSTAQPSPSTSSPIILLNDSIEDPLAAATAGPELNEISYDEIRYQTSVAELRK